MIFGEKLKNRKTKSLTGVGNVILPVFTVTPPSKPFNKQSQESKKKKKMNILTVWQRFRSVQCFVRDIFEKMFDSNL